MGEDPVSRQQQFDELARGKQKSLVGEIVHMLRVNKKWWLVPLCFMALAIGALFFLSGTVAAPLIYTLF